MAKLIIQNEWELPTDTELLVNEPIVIHRTSSCGDHLVVFVHGLGGSRYGEGSTWGDFPRFIFEEFRGDLTSDVALYGYRTLTKRFGFSKSIDLEDEARVFADIVRDLTDYQSVILIGHSMGGLLCKAAISYLIDSNQTDVLRRISGLGLMATPQLGSMRVPGVARLFSRDFRALQPHGNFVSNVESTFQNHLCLDPTEDPGDKITVPTWVVTGAEDFWVDQLSAGINIGANRKKTVRGSHTDIVKPRSLNSDAYSWSRDQIRSSMQWSAEQILTQRSQTESAYDVFIAAPMASFSDDGEYLASRGDILKLIETLKSECGFNAIFYAGKNISDGVFEAADLSLETDLEALRNSKNFLLLFPEKIVSSVIFEAGAALAYERPAIYFARDRDDLPFLMKEASQAVPFVKFYKYADVQDIINLVVQHKRDLFPAAPNRT